MSTQKATSNSKGNPPTKKSPKGTSTTQGQPNKAQQSQKPEKGTKDSDKTNKVAGGNGPASPVEKNSKGTSQLKDSKGQTNQQSNEPLQFVDHFTFDPKGGERTSQTKGRETTSTTPPEGGGSKNPLQTVADAASNALSVPEANAFSPLIRATGGKAESAFQVTNIQSPISFGDTFDGGGGKWLAQTFGKLMGHSETAEESSSVADKAYERETALGEKEKRFDHTQYVNTTVDNLPSALNSSQALSPVSYKVLDGYGNFNPVTLQEAREMGPDWFRKFGAVIAVYETDELGTADERKHIAPEKFPLVVGQQMPKEDLK